MRRLVRAWFATAATMLLVFAGVAANGAWRTIVAEPVPETTPRAAATQEAAPHGAIPVAAPAPAPGVTGTIDLPTLPVPSLSADRPAAGAIPAAAPFTFGRASATDRGRALECLAAAIYYEARSEPDAGQQAVAQVVLNRVRHPAFPHTVCGVVYQGSERAGCQFSFACDGAMARVVPRSGWVRAARVAALALAGRVYAPVGLATHYHTYAVTPSWNRGLVMTGAVGAHFFHRWKGWWGTPVAFATRYAGGEPVPGPHPAAVAAPVVMSTPVPSAPIAAAPSVRAATTDGPAVVVVSADPPPPGSGEVLDQWKDSGTPLR